MDLVSDSDHHSSSPPQPRETASRSTRPAGTFIIDGQHIFHYPSEVCASNHKKGRNNRKGGYLSGMIKMRQEATGRVEIDMGRISVITPRLWETEFVMVGRVLANRRNENRWLDEVGEMHTIRSLYKTLSDLHAIKIIARVTMEDGSVVTLLSNTIRATNSKDHGPLEFSHMHPTKAC